MEQLQDLAQDKYCKEEQPSPGENEFLSSTMPSSINARLWFLIQLGLIDPLASTRLKTLHASKRPSKLDAASRDMLEDSLMQEKDDESLFNGLGIPWDEYFGQCGGVSGRDVMDFEDQGNSLLMDEEILVEDRIEHGKSFWEELEEDESREMCQARYENATAGPDPDEEYYELLEDGMEEVLNDRTVDEHKGCLTGNRFGGPSCQKEYWGDVEISISE